MTKAEEQRLRRALAALRRRLRENRELLDCYRRAKASVSEGTDEG